MRERDTLGGGTAATDVDMSGTLRDGISGAQRRDWRRDAHSRNSIVRICLLPSDKLTDRYLHTVDCVEAAAQARPLKKRARISGGDDLYIEEVRLFRRNLHEDAGKNLPF
jgi:hypothetical protein